MIAIVDYGVGNLQSVVNALSYLGEQAVIAKTGQQIQSADRVILPGVGAFGFAMQQLRSSNLEKPVKKFIKSGKPFLGICVGMQMLFEQSEESPGVSGMGIFKGKVVKFTKGKVPQVGWNSIIPQKTGLFEEGFVYFVNSYYVVPDDDEIVACSTDYFGGFASAIQKDNIAAVQFHPEKSGNVGIELLRRWLKC